VPEKDELEYSSPAKMHLVGNSKKILEISELDLKDRNNLIKI
jgi:hypothetical protein